MLTFLLNWLGFALIFIAIDYKRTPETKLILFTNNWFIIVALVVAASILINI